ncbi:MAG: hypothetical protein JRL30_01140 [Deltaproteobacteria bacterium]|nr:hypothetical protein [Deltaproteobacteria bacterium]
MAITKVASEIKIGAAEALWATVTLGHTEEGQTARLTKTLAERKVDQYGDSLVDQVLVGMQVEVTLNIAQWIYDTLLIAYPEATKGTGDYIHAGGEPGQLMSTESEELILRPYGATGSTEDTVIKKAYVREVGDISYTNDGDRLVAVTFEGLLDTTKGNGAMLWALYAPEAGA